MASHPLVGIDNKDICKYSGSPSLWDDRGRHLGAPNRICSLFAFSAPTVSSEGAVYNPFLSFKGSDRIYSILAGNL
jgi:hypothetical protein